MNEHFSEDICKGLKPKIPEDTSNLLADLGCYNNKLTNY